MNDTERRLAALFAADVPPATDRAFAFAVLTRIERRRAWLNVLETIPVAMAGAALLWLLAPSIDELLRQGLAAVDLTFAATVVLTLTAIAFVSGESIRELWETAFD